MNIFKEKQNKTKYLLLTITLLVCLSFLIVQKEVKAQDADWSQVNTNGFGDGNNTVSPSITLFNGYLYIGTQNTATGGEVWRTNNGTDWSQVNAAGFGSGNNGSVTSLLSFGSNLYAGTLNTTTGAEIWRCSQASGCNTAGDWVQVASGGFGDANNDIAQSMETFNNYIYVGTRNNTSGAEVFRSSNGTVWNQVNNDGFGVAGLVRIDTLESFNNALYAGTGIAATEVWRCTLASSCNAPGDWVQMASGGFGDASNRQVETLIPFGSNLYAGTFRIVGGGEIWRSSNGSSWTEVVGDGSGGGNGFGDTNNSSMLSTSVSNGYLYFGTRNAATGAEVWRTSNGTAWTQINDNGFGDGNNDISSAMIDFNSRLFVATSNLISGTEVWRANYIPEGSSLSAVQLTDGSGNVSIAISVDDIEDDTLQARVEYNIGSGWQKATISTDDADTTATYGDPNVNNSNAYQLSSIITSSGANSVTTIWDSAIDVPTADVTDARIRIRLFDTISQSNWYTSTAFDLDNVAPNPPTLNPVTSPTNITPQTISGGKDTNVSVLQAGSVIVTLDASTTWSYNLDLLEGTNSLSLTSRDDKGNESSATTGSIILDTTPPNTEANPPGGTYIEAFDVTLSADEAGSTIYYTTDGSDPDTSSLVYSGPIRISSNATLKFFGVDSLGNQESINEEVYVIAPALISINKSVSVEAASSAPPVTSGFISGNINSISKKFENFIKYPDYNLYSKLGISFLTIILGLFAFVIIIVIASGNKTNKTNLSYKVVKSFKFAFYKNKKIFSAVLLAIALFSFSEFLLAYNIISAADAEVERGDVLTYRIDYSNISTDTAANFYFIDPIPSYTEYVDSSMVLNGVAVTDTADADSADYNNTWPGHVYFNIGDLASRASGYITFQARVIDTAPHGALVSNRAVGGYNSEDIRIESNTVTNVVQVAQGGPDGTVIVPTRREEISEEETIEKEEEKVIDTDQEAEIGRKNIKDEQDQETISTTEEIGASVFGKIQDINKWIIAPLLAFLGLLNLLTAFSLGSLSSFLRYLWQVLTEPLLYLGKKKRKGWGVVYNSQTKEPIDLALVRLYDQETKKLIETKVTDFEGRYVFLVEPNKEYYVEASKQGFSFPSRIIASQKSDNNQRKLYYGETISFSNNDSKNQEKGYINYDIPLDQKEGVVFNNRISNKPIKTDLGSVSKLEKASYSKLEKDNDKILGTIRGFQIHKLLGFLGPILGFINFIVTPSIFTFILLIVHIVLVVVFIKLAQIKDIKPFGRVYNLDDNQSLAQSVVRLFDQKYGKLLSVTVSKSDGRYGFLIGDDKYLLNSNKKGFIFPAKKIQVIGDRGKLVRENLGMKEEN